MPRPVLSSDVWRAVVKSTGKRVMSTTDVLKALRVHNNGKTYAKWIQKLLKQKYVRLMLEVRFLCCCISGIPKDVLLGVILPYLPNFNVTLSLGRQLKLSRVLHVHGTTHGNVTEWATYPTAGGRHVEATRKYRVAKRKRQE